MFFSRLNLLDEIEPEERQLRTELKAEYLRQKRSKGAEHPDTVDVFVRLVLRYWQNKSKIPATMMRRIWKRRDVLYAQDEERLIDFLLLYADALLFADQEKAALPVAKEAYERIRNRIDPPSPDVLQRWLRMAAVLRNCGDTDCAVSSLEEGLHILEQLQLDAKDRSYYLRRLSDQYAMCGKNNVALLLLERRQELYRELYQPDSTEALQGLRDLSRAASNAGKFETAHMYAAEECRRAADAYGVSAPRTFSARQRLIETYAEMGQHERMLEEARALYAPDVGAARIGDVGRDIAANEHLAWCHTKAGLHREAMPYYERAYALRVTHDGVVDLQTQWALQELAEAYEQAGLHEESQLLTEEFGRRFNEHQWGRDTISLQAMFAAEDALDSAGVQQRD